MDIALTMYSICSTISLHIHKYKKYLTLYEHKDISKRTLPSNDILFSGKISGISLGVCCLLLYTLFAPFEKWTSSVVCVLHYLLDLHVITVRITLVILTLTCGPLLSVQSMWMSVRPSGTLNHEPFLFLLPPSCLLVFITTPCHSSFLNTRRVTHKTTHTAPIVLLIKLTKLHVWAGLRWFFPSLSCKYLVSLFGHYGVKVKQYSYYLGEGNFPKWASKCYAEAFGEWLLFVCRGQNF